MAPGGIIVRSLFVNYHTFEYYYKDSHYVTNYLDINFFQHSIMISCNTDLT